MGRKAKPKTDKDIIKARKVVMTYRDSPSIMCREDQMKLVGMYYPTIKGVSLDNVSDNQLYKIASRLYESAQKVSKMHTSYDEVVLKEISKLENLSKRKISLENEIMELDERICIKIENLPDDHLLVRKYKEIKE